jgi:hypothetical protein
MSLLAAALAVIGTYGIGSRYQGGTRWAPDVRFYAVRSLEFAGRSHEEAKVEAAAFLYTHGIERRYPIDEVDSPTNRQFRPRILYPLVSAPFVAVAGMRGLLIVSLLSTIALFAVMWRLFSRRAPPWLAAAVVVLIANVHTLTGYSIAALTDGLAMALAAGALLAFPGEERERGVPWLAFAATLAAGLTREVSHYPLLAAAGGWAWARWRAPGHARAWRATVLATATANVLALAWAAGYGRGVMDQIERFTGRTGIAAFGGVPPLLGDAFRATAQGFMRERLLMLVTAVAIVGVVRQRREREPWLLAGALVATFAVLVINPISTGLRLQLPIIPYIAILAARELASWKPFVSVRDGASRRRWRFGRNGIVGVWSEPAPTTARSPRRTEPVGGEERDRGCARAASSPADRCCRRSPCDCPAPAGARRSWRR